MSSGFPPTRSVDVVVLGAGLIGLAIALELNDRGAKVTVVDRGRSLAGASTAAAGMLAAEDPGNPPELKALSGLSIKRYPAFLHRIETLSGIAVPFQTEATMQYLEGGPTLRLQERSIDPRQLALGVYAAVQATSIRLLEHTQVAAIEDNSAGIMVHLSSGAVQATRSVLYAAGAWSSELMKTLSEEPIPVSPRKGQMLRVRLPFALDEVHRSEQIYIVPRTCGPQAGTALIGATLEDAGFDTCVSSDALNALRIRAAQIIPALASDVKAPMVESWAGLRPATPDGLPILGACSHAGRFIATGHYRNGILQAPATALVMADLLEGRAPAVDLSGLSAQRYALSPTT
jgi:glycine oxidase